MKEAGVERVVKKKPKVVEEHYDDCGQDLSGLGPDAVEDAADYYVTLLIQPSEERYERQDLETCYEQASSLATYFLKGSEASVDDYWPREREGLRITTCFEEFYYVSNQVASSSYERDDVVELCGGAARVSVICCRRRLKK